MSSNNNASTTPTVCFDVGGTVYKVSRSLLEMYPHTMLARMASEEWQPKDADGRANPKPLFIDRDGERFRYCLDYMRDGGVVSLPFTVSREAFLNDLLYYGFDEVDPDAVAVRGGIVAFKSSYDYLTSLCKERKIAALSALESAGAKFETVAPTRHIRITLRGKETCLCVPVFERDKVALKNATSELDAHRHSFKIEMLAIYCAKRFCNDGDLHVTVAMEVSDTDPLNRSPCDKISMYDLFKTAMIVCQIDNERVTERKFQTCLAVFGLKQKRIIAYTGQRCTYRDRVEIELEPI